MGASLHKCSANFCNNVFDSDRDPAQQCFKCKQWYCEKCLQKYFINLNNVCTICLKKTKNLQFLDGTLLKFALMELKTSLSDLSLKYYKFREQKIIEYVDKNTGNQLSQILIFKISQYFKEICPEKVDKDNWIY